MMRRPSAQRRRPHDSVVGSALRAGAAEHADVGENVGMPSNAESLQNTNAPEGGVAKFLGQLGRKQWTIAIRAIVCGLIAGLLVALYRYGIGYGTRFAQWMYPQILSQPWLIAPFVCAAAIIGLIVAWLVRLEPMASGSGIPQVEGVLLLGLRMRWLLVLVVRFAGGLLCGMFGLSLGREGPSIQIGAAASQGVSGAMKRDGFEENTLITAGAAAGLSAAFNAPLSGMMFALEEVHRNFSPVILLSAASASLSADFVSKTWFGLRPVLNFTSIGQLALPLYWWMIPLGIVAGLVGSLTNRMLLGFQTLYGKLPALAGPVIALLIALPCGLFAPKVLGGGEELIDFAEHASSGVLVLLGLLAVKMLFTGTSFGSGVPGGIFMPILAIGTLSGSIFGLLAAQLLPGIVPQSAVAVFAVCAMAGTLSASVKAPMTSILLAVEMSGSLVHMLPVAACAFIALFVADLLGTKPIYGALLERYLAAHDGGRIDRSVAGDADAGMECPSSGKEEGIGDGAADGRAGTDASGGESDGDDNGGRAAESDVSAMAESSAGIAREAEMNGNAETRIAPDAGNIGRAHRKATAITGTDGAAASADDKPVKATGVAAIAARSRRQFLAQWQRILRSPQDIAAMAAVAAVAHSPSRASSGNAVLEFPVEFGSAIAGLRVGDIEWPDSAAPVDIRRGEREVVPRREETIMPGDYVFVMFPTGDLAQVRAAMVALCSSRM
jgi:H+/Cl- antiporter ClcA